MGSANGMVSGTTTPPPAAGPSSLLRGLVPLRCFWWPADEPVPVAYSIPSHLVVPLGVCILTCACVDRLLIYGNVILSRPGEPAARNA